MNPIQLTERARHLPLFVKRAETILQEIRLVCTNGRTPRKTPFYWVFFAPLIRRKLYDFNRDWLALNDMPCARLPKPLVFWSLRHRPIYAALCLVGGLIVSYAGWFLRDDGWLALLLFLLASHVLTAVMVVVVISKREPDKLQRQHWYVGAFGVSGVIGTLYTLIEIYAYHHWKKDGRCWYTIAWDHELLTLAYRREATRLRTYLHALTLEEYDRLARTESTIEFMRDPHHIVHLDAEKIAHARTAIEHKRTLLAGIVERQESTLKHIDEWITKILEVAASNTANDRRRLRQAEDGLAVSYHLLERVRVELRDLKQTGTPTIKRVEAVAPPAPEESPDDKHRTVTISGIHEAIH